MGSKPRRVYSCTPVLSSRESHCSAEKLEREKTPAPRHQGMGEKKEWAKGKGAAYTELWEKNTMGQQKMEQAMNQSTRRVITCSGSRTGL